MKTTSQETIDFVDEMANQGLQILVVEEESAMDLQVILNELRRQGYAKILGFSTAGTPGDIRYYWRYTAVVEKSGPTVRETKTPRRSGQNSQS